MVKNHMFLEDFERIHLTELMYLQQIEEEWYFAELTKTTVELGTYDNKKSRNHNKQWPFRKGESVRVSRGKSTKARHESPFHP